MLFKKKNYQKVSRLFQVFTLSPCHSLLWYLSIFIITTHYCQSAAQINCEWEEILIGCIPHKILCKLAEYFLPHPFPFLHLFPLLFPQCKKKKKKKVIYPIFSESNIVLSPFAFPSFRPLLQCYFPWEVFCGRITKINTPYFFHKL